MPRRADPPVRLAARTLAPWFVDGELAGLRAGAAELPFPGCGIETELGIAVPGSRGAVGQALGAVLARRTGVPARAVGDRSGALPFEVDRLFDPLGSTYREGDHYEANTWFRRAAPAARWNLELLLERAGREAAEVAGGVFLHATGGDGQGSTWSSLHVNTAISDLGYAHLCANYRACSLALDYYLPAQISLAVVDGNGGVDPTGFLLSDRIGEFDAVFGPGTMRPARAMLVDRSEGFGNARVMHMLRALSFGRASCAGLVATQVDTLVCDLAVHGVLEVPSIRLGDPVAAARELAFHRRRHDLARMQERVQSTRWQVVDALSRALGEAFVERLIPGVREELSFVDAALAAVARDDERELVEHCDWARKQAVLMDFLGNRGRSWSAGHGALLELNFHYARLDADALRHVWPGAALPPGHRPDHVPAETSSYLLWWLCSRAAQEQSWHRDLSAVDLSWQGLRRSEGGWLEPQGGAWPWAARRCEAIELQPWRFTRAAIGQELDDCASLDELFAAIGRSHEHYGDYAGRSYGPSTGGPSVLHGNDEVTR